MAQRIDYEQRFESALGRIVQYDSIATLRRYCGKSYGLQYQEALEMAYENVKEEAKLALRGRKKRNKPATSAAAVDPVDGVVTG